MRQLIVIALITLLFGPAWAEQPYKTVTVGDVKLAYVEEGEGPAVIFLHGLVQDYRYWEAQNLPFSKRFRLIFYSRRTHYPTFSTLSSTSGRDVYIKDLLGLMNALNIEQAHLVGHSLGANTAAAFAALYPDRVLSLTLSSPALQGMVNTATEDKARIDAFRALLKPAQDLVRMGKSHEGAEAYFDVLNGPGTFKSLSALHQEIMNSNARLLVTKKDGPQFVQFTCVMGMELTVPVLVLSGEQDHGYFLDGVKKLKQCLPAITSITIPGAKHSLPTLSPVEFQREVEVFLLKNNPPERGQPSRLSTK